MKKFLLVILALLITIPTFAQSDTELVAIALDSMNLQLITITRDGSDTIIDLPIPEGAFTSQSMMTISNDGRYAAICYGESGASVNEYSMIALELETNAIILEKSLGQVHMCDASAFDNNNQYLATSVVISAPSYDGTSQPEWSLDIYELATGEIVNSLTRRDSILAAFVNFQPEPPIWADVKHFDGEYLTFAAIPYVGMGGINDVPAFTWSLIDDTVTVAPNFGKLQGDSIAQWGEIVFPFLNQDFNAAMPSGPIPQANEVHLVETGNEQVIYRNTDWVITDAEFVNNGNNVAVLLLENADMESEFSDQIVELINRDGTVTTFTETYEAYAQLGNWSGGALVLWGENPSGGTPPTHIRLLHTDGTSEDIWTYQAPMGERGFTFLELVWSQPILANDSSTPQSFTPIN